jgi:hypothetical protein
MWKDGRIIPSQPVDWPDGTALTLEPVEEQRETESEEGLLGNDPASIARCGVPGRVAPGDCSPGAPTDPYVPSRAYGSSYHELATGRLPE